MKWIKHEIDFTEQIKKWKRESSASEGDQSVGKGCSCGEHCNKECKCECHIKMEE